MKTRFNLVEAMDDLEIEESVGSEKQDRLSELPLSLILLILSLLPIRDVISTTFLSKHWRNLWTVVPCLNFCGLGKEAERVRNFVNSALKMWKGSKILVFRFDFVSHFDMSLARDVDSWVRFAVEHNVEMLEMRLVYDRDKVSKEWRSDAVMCSKREVYTLPQCLYSCSSIRKLILVGCNLCMDVSPSWGRLKCLMLKGFCFSECLVDRIMSGSPSLEVFELFHLEAYENLNICSKSLKRLVIAKYLYLHSDKPSRDKVLRVCCPNLETLEVSRVSYSKCLFKNVSSLTDLRLGCYGSIDVIHLDRHGKELHQETIRQILPTIQHVPKLTLSVCSVETLRALQKKKLLSPLPNVMFLKLTVGVGYSGLFDYDYSDAMNLLGAFPNLKILEIDDWTALVPSDPLQLNKVDYSKFETAVSESSPLQLKSIRVTSPMTSSSIFQTIAYLLRHAIVLEKFVVRIVRVISYPPTFSFEVTKTLESFPRSSPTASVITIK